MGADRSFTLLTRSTVAGWLREENHGRLQTLWDTADAVRRQYVGDAIHLRGLVEISNHCRRNCLYCGLRRARTNLARYRMTTDEIVACAHETRQRGYGTVVLQSGDDPGIGAAWLAEVIRRIKRECALAVTLSVGERTAGELACWREAGADRYLLRFETSDPKLYAVIHPGLQGRASHPTDRLAILAQLRAQGYEVGSGMLIGIPGQTYSSLANDLLLFREFDLDMVGVGPFIPHPATPLAQAANAPPHPDQVPRSELMTYKVLALTRLLCPEANIPSTTALATLSDMREAAPGLMRGANVVMPCLTPPPYLALYDIYPGKAETTSTEDWHHALREYLRASGRPPGQGNGSRHAAVTKRS